MPELTAGVKMGGDDTVPLSLACRTVAKGGAKLALVPDTNAAEIKVILSCFFSSNCYNILSPANYSTHQKIV